MKSVICPRRDGAAVEDEEQPRKNHHYQRRVRTLKETEELCPRITLGTAVTYYSCSSNSQLVGSEDCIFL